MSSEIRKKLDRIHTKIEKLAVYGKEKTQDYYLLIEDFINKGDYANFELCLYYNYGIDVSEMQTVDDVKKKTWPEILLQTQLPFLKKLSKLYKSKNVYQQSFDIYSIDPKFSQLQLNGPLSVTYSTVAGSQSISLTKQNNQVKLNVLDPSINRILIYRSEWVDVSGSERPTNNEILHKFEISNLNQLVTDIPITHNSEYLITVEKRPVITVTASSFSITNYKYSVSLNPYLGQIREIDDFVSNQYLKDYKLEKEKRNINIVLQVDKIGATQSIFINQKIPDISADSNLLAKYKLALDILLS